MENVVFEEGVEASWQSAEGSGEEDEGYQCAVGGFEALEEGKEREGVEEEVREGFVEEWEGV